MGSFKTELSWPPRLRVVCLSIYNLHSTSLRSLLVIDPSNKLYLESGDLNNPLLPHVYLSARHQVGATGGYIEEVIIQHNTTLPLDVNLFCNCINPPNGFFVNPMNYVKRFPVPPFTWAVCLISLETSVARRPNREISFVFSPNKWWHYRLLYWLRIITTIVPPRQTLPGCLAPVIKLIFPIFLQQLGVLLEWFSRTTSSRSDPSNVNTEWQALMNIDHHENRLEKFRWEIP